MCVDFEFFDTSCCAIGTIAEESFEEERPTISAAAKEIRRRVKDQRADPPLTFTMIIATVTSGQFDEEWWKKVYRKAGFKQFGKPLRNPNSGNIVTKFYIDVPEDFKA